MDKIISRKECASGRLSLIDCPAGCPHNPFGFAAYPRFRELEARWFDKAIRRAKQFGDWSSEFPPEAARVPQFVRDWMEVQAMMNVLLGKGPLTSGTLMEQWAEDRTSSLNNDERLMTRYRARTRATVIEVQRPLKGNRAVVVDLFAPDEGESVIFFENITRAPRFSRHFGWFTWFPNFIHPIASTIRLPPHLWAPWKNEILAEVRHRRNLDYTLTAHRFLQEEFLNGVELFEELVRKWEEFKNPPRAPLHYAGVYEVREEAARLAARFDAHSSCAPLMVLPVHPTYGACHGEWRFVLKGTPEELNQYDPYLGSEYDGDGERTTGMFSLYSRVLLFHCNCQAAYDLGRALLDQEFQDGLHFERDDILRANTVLENQEPVFGVDPLPLPVAPRLPGGGFMPWPEEREPEANLPQIQEFIRNHHQETFADFLDEPHDLLDDRTPRDAARTPEGRAQLLELLKTTIYELEVRNRQFQTELEINALLEELGFSELILVESAPGDA